MSALTVAEQIKLSQLEDRIERGVQASLEMAQALLTIRKESLYRAEHSTFEVYCQVRWGFGDRYAQMLIGFAEAVQNLEERTTVRPLPANERQARPLTPLQPEQQTQAWEAATTIAPNHKPASSHATRAVAAVKSKPAQSPSVGSKVTVLDETSEHYGKEAEVISTQSGGVIVECKVEGAAKSVPFLRNEVGDRLQPPKPEKIQQAQPAQPKTNHFAGLQSELDIERLRVELLERELAKLIEAIENGKSVQDLRVLAAEVKKLIA